MDMREHIEQSNLIEGITGVRELEQSMRAWTFLIAQPELTHAVIHETQRLIVANDRSLRDNERGAYRDLSNTNVSVGTHVPPRWYEVVDLMVDWLGGVKERTPWRNHAYFEGIHPFVHGNGRTGRMLMWLQQIELEEEPRLFEASKKYDYYLELDAERYLQGRN